MHASITTFHNAGSIIDCGKAEMYCKLCPERILKPTKYQWRIKKHMRAHTKSSVPCGEYVVFGCHMACRGGDKKHAHYHCPICKKILARKVLFVGHLKICDVKKMESSVHLQGTERETPTSSQDSSDQKKELSDTEDEKSENPAPLCRNTRKRQAHVSQSHLNKIKIGSCKICNKRMLKKNLKRHIRTKHINLPTAVVKEGTHHDGVLVDAANGIYLVDNSRKGEGYPVHVQRKVGSATQQTKCESSFCNTRGRNVTHLCPHLQSTSFLHPTEEITLDNEVLSNMNTELSEARKTQCLSLKQEAEKVHAPIIAAWNPLGPSKYLYFSVFDGQIKYYSRLGRVLVTLDKSTGIPSCKCCSARRNCTHKTIVKWYLMQTVKESEVEESRETTSYIADGIPDKCKGNTVKMIKYLMTEKRIDVSGISAKEYKWCTLTEVIPSEDKCQLCDSNSDLETILLSSNGVIIDRDSFSKDITVYVKSCPSCHVTYRYQEFSDGIHNYNNKVFLTHRLCLWLKANVKTHIAIGVAIETLENFQQQSMPVSHDDIINGYLHFEALSTRNYDFSCVLCGHFPAILIMELNRNTAFDLEDTEEPTNACDTVDASLFWEGINCEIIARGFYPVTTDSPFRISPSMSFWAPWISPQARGEEIYNTEYKKCPKPSPNNDDSEVENELSEELLVELLYKSKVSQVKEICRHLNISDVGSHIDCVERLSEILGDKSSFNKVFAKLWGGWLSASCPHKIVYGFKPLLKVESPRDFVDLLLSLKHQPSVVISDIADLIAKHGNKRQPGMFSPHDGMLCAPTEENIKAAESGNLTINLPYIEKGVCTPTNLQQMAVQTDRNYSTMKAIHPTTQSSDTLSLFDWFHHGDCKDPREILRSVSLVPELCDWGNIQAEEELFESLGRDQYFLNNMTSSTNLFILRLAVNEHNTAINQNTVSTMEEQTGNSVKIEADEQA
ncbi:uncharacterized protein [Ptychodera flava]|uniref:uncharacterized protein isoform X2 n=1 Tax=Ptychodera flava TaxID=63121 RepID=UPI00396A3A00